MSGSYQLMRVATGESIAEPVTKDQLNRKIRRHVRALKTISSGKALAWFLKSVWPVLLFQTLFACINIYLKLQHGWTAAHDLLMIPPGPPPFLMLTMQFICAFMTGLALNEGAARFKTCMASLLEFKKSFESLRSSLLASTSDPLLEVSVQVFLTLAVVLLNKDITFFTVDFSRPILEPVCESFKHSIFFQPEMLWTFDRHQWQFIFHEFLSHSWMADKEGNVKALCKETLESWKRLEELLTVRAPATRHWITAFTLQLFFVLVPLLNADIVTQLMTPMVASILVAINTLAAELGDPWNESDLNAVPLHDTLLYLAAPVDTVSSTPERIEYAIHWLNRGLMEGKWRTVPWPVEEDEKHWDDDTTGKCWIPRIKDTYPNVGQKITFQYVRTIPQIANRAHWQDFMEYVGKDMDKATSNGFRMPGHLRMGCLKPHERKGPPREFSLAGHSW